MKNLIKKILAHNWVASVYLNFKMLPFRQALYFPLDCYGKIRFEKLSGKIVLDSSKLYRGMIKLGAQGSDMFPRVESVLSIEGRVDFRGSCTIGASFVLISKNRSILDFGDNVTLGARCLVYTEEKIVFENNVLTSWDCQFMDSDTHHVINNFTNESFENSKLVVIGEHSWIGNHVSFNKGSLLPPYSIVASNSLVNKDFSAFGRFCLFGGVPAKMIKDNVSWRI